MRILVMTVRLASVAAMLVAAACLSEEESVALDSFRATRAQLADNSRSYLRAALNADSLSTAGLGSDSALVDVLGALARDDALVRAAADSLMPERLELGTCRARLFFRVPWTGHDEYGIAEFRCEGVVWRVSRLMLPVDVD